MQADQFIVTVCKAAFALSLVAAAVMMRHGEREKPSGEVRPWEMSKTGL